MSDESLLFKIGITLIPGIGNVNAKKLISYCGSVEQIFKEKKEHLMKIPGFGEEIAKAIINQKVLKRAEKEIDFLNKNNVNYSFYLDKEYPQRLLQCEDGPVMLYYKGEINFNHPKIISIVGTRNISEYGKRICELLI